MKRYDDMKNDHIAQHYMVVPLLSMEGQKALGFHQKYLKVGITHTVSPNLMLILSTYRVVLHPSYLQKFLVLSYL